MPLVCPWRQGTTDRDVTTRLKFSQPERILGELVDGKEPFVMELPNFLRRDPIQQTEVILLDGLRSAHALKLAGGAVAIQYDRGRLG